MTMIYKFAWVQAQGKNKLAPAEKKLCWEDKGMLISIVKEPK